MKTQIKSKCKSFFNSFPIIGLIYVVGLIIAGYVLSFISPYNSFGIIPREFSINLLIGILFSWTMHSNFSHLTNNLIALLPLLIVFCVVEQHWKRILFLLIVGSGAFTWLFGSTAVHIGASGLIFALTGFILVSSIIRKKWLYLLFVALSFSYIWYALYKGLMPQDGVSLSAHLGGLIFGCIYAYFLRTLK